MLVDRRTFIQTGSACLTGLALERSGLPEWPRAGTAPGGRVLPLNQNWRFSRLTSSKMVEREYDDSAFEAVTLPHTNVSLPWHDVDQSS